MLDLAAIDMEAALRRLATEFARKKAEVLAREWVTTGKVPRTPMATIARTLREEANAKDVQSMRRDKAAGAGTTRNRSTRREIDEA